MGPRDRSPRGGSRRWPYPQRSGIEQLGDMDRNDALAFVRQTGDLLMVHKFGVDELMTRLRIWSEEFDYAHEHDPIEHITSRIKRPEAIAAKLAQRGLPVDPVSAREHLTDIAGVRVVCKFISDVYLIRDLIRQHQIEIVQTKDYIAAPKPNGYRSLHLIIKVPVHLSDRTELVAVELQLRTIAMDFWAAVEHELLYKNGGEVPKSFAAELKAAAEAAAGLDAQMSSLHERSEGTPG